MSCGWHVSCEAGVLTASRRLPARFDLAVTARFPAVGKRRLAFQIRQDMWRLLQSLRGFSPVVRIAPEGADLRVTAGGSVAGQYPRAHCEAILSEMLADQALRARWVRFAGGDGRG